MLPWVLQCKNISHWVSLSTFPSTDSILWTCQRLVPSNSASPSSQSFHRNLGDLTHKPQLPQTAFPTTLPPSSFCSAHWSPPVPSAAPLSWKALPDSHVVCSPTSPHFHSNSTFSEKASLTFYVTIWNSTNTHKKTVFYLLPPRHPLYPAEFSFIAPLTTHRTGPALEQRWVSCSFLPCSSVGGQGSLRGALGPQQQIYLDTLIITLVSWW